jgi:RNA polymerase sigma-70 factor, ECF subfamily
VNEKLPDDQARREHEARMSTTSFDTFYAKYERRLSRYLISRASDTQLAEEVANDTMKYAYDKWDYLLTKDRPDHWLFKVGTNRLNRLEAKYRRASFLREDLNSFENDLRMVAKDDPWIEVRIDLIVALRSLRHHQREVITLHYFADQTLAEIARLMNLSEGTVKQHLHRGLKRLSNNRRLRAATEVAKGVPA